jgi:hypothetical protein
MEIKKEEEDNTQTTGKIRKNKNKNKTTPKGECIERIDTSATQLKIYICTKQQPEKLSRLYSTHI